MRSLWWIVALLVVVAVTEIAVLIAVGSVIGVGWTVVLVLATSLLGGWLLKHEGGRAWRAMRAEVTAGRPPGRPVTDGMLVLVGGVLMLFPGFVSDVVGLLMIVPATRGLFRGTVERLVGRRLAPGMTGELFGPRTVKIRQGRVEDPGPPIEGEIV